MTDHVGAIARAVLYEGYILWPYRRSAAKNRQRWTFGGVFPPAWSEVHPDDIPSIEAQFLVEGSPAAILTTTLRFLQVVERHVHDGDGFVDELELDGERHLSWEEAREREVALPPSTLGSLVAPLRAPVDFPAAAEEEPLAGSAAIVRTWQAVAGSAELSARQLEPGLFRVTVRVENATPWAGEDRSEALRHTLVSTHVALTVEGGAFVSQQADPPERLRAAAAECRSSGVWPILVGEQGDRTTMLCSPIILEDWPRIAPESPGDLFDGGEIDQLLILNILALTDAEKEEMRASDPRAREILDRCSDLSHDDLRRLHLGRATL